jgi:hypothetical protein
MHIKGVIGKRQGRGMGDVAGDVLDSKARARNVAKRIYLTLAWDVLEGCDKCANLPTCDRGNLAHLAWSVPA